MRMNDLKDWGEIVDGHIVEEDGEQWIRKSRIEEFILPHVAINAFRGGSLR